MESPSLLITVPEAARLACLSRSKMYQIVAAGSIPVLRIGKATRVRRDDLAAWIESRLSYPSRTGAAELGNPAGIGQERL